MEFRHIFQRITKVLRITETIIDYFFSQVRFRTRIFEKSSFLLSLDIKDMQKRYIPEKA